MALVGLRRRNALCKICCSFSEELLNEITLDILLHRRTYKEIKEYYNPKLPTNILPLSDVNINNHRKHSDPATIAESVLKQNGDPVTDAEMLAVLFKERYNQELDNNKILQEIYRQRLHNLEMLQNLLEEKKRELRSIGKTEDRDLISRKDSLQDTIFSLTKEIDNIHNSLQNIIIREGDSKNGNSPGTIHITQNFVNVFQGQLKSFMDEIVPYFLLKIFPDDINKGKEVVKFLSQTMDRYLTPVLAENNIIEKVHPLN